MIGRIALISICVTSICLLGAIFLAKTSYDAFVGPPSTATVIESNALTTDTWGIFNPETGALVLGKNEYTPKPIASITKLFTANAVLESAALHKPFTVEYTDVLTEGRAGKLSYGDVVTPYELLFPLLLESSNDAGVAISRTLGDEYETRITATVSELGLTETFLDDATGLSPKNISTVTDLSRFFAHLKSTHPHVLDITQLYTYIGKDEGYINNDPARELSNFTGGKHGYTDEARRTFIGTFVSSVSGKELGIVLLGSEDLRKDIQSLLRYSESIP